VENKFSPLQFMKNVVSNGGIFVINTLVSFWFTPYLVQSLGAELYGFIPLVTAVVSYFGIITLSLNASTSRYLMIELEKEDYEKSNEIFNTSIVGMLTMILVAIPFGVALVLYATDIFQVPPDSRWEVQLLLIGSILAFFLTTLRSAFSIASYSQNRFDLRNIVNFLGRLAQVIIVLLLFTADQPNLIYAGLGLIAVALVSLLGDIVLWKRLLPVLKIRLRMFNKYLLREMVGTSFWMLINRVGFLIFLNIEMIVANHSFTLVIAGMYGALLTIPNNLRTIASTVNGVWGPLILSKFSRDDFEGIDRVARTSMKLIGLSIALPIGFVCGAAREFLVLWLGPEFEVLTWVAVVMAFHLCINLVTEPLGSIQVSMNKVKLPALATFITGIVAFFASVFAAQKFGPLGLATAGGIVLALRNVFFNPIYTAVIMEKSWWNYLVRLLPIVFVTLVVALVSYGLIQILEVENLLVLLAVGGLISVVYVVLAFFLGLNQKEKGMMLNSALRRLP
jgi:membrane protein EpsK